VLDSPTLLALHSTPALGAVTACKEQTSQEISYSTFALGAVTACKEQTSKEIS
jgi:hypothetical protein